MKVAFLDGLLLCAALLTAHATTSQSSSDLPLISQSSSSASVFVEVHGDAVYCVEGPVCGGAATSQPIGRGCPKQGGKAIDACMKGIPSFSAADGQCIAPTDAECRVVPGTQVWGCMWASEGIATTAPDASVPATASPASPSQSPLEVATLPPQATPEQRLRVVQAAAVTSGSDASDATSFTTIWIGSVAAVGGAMAVVVVVVVLLRHTRKASQQTRDSDLSQVMVITPDNLPVVTPKLSNTLFVYTAQI